MQETPALTTEALAASVERLHQRMDRLEGRLERLLDVLEAAPAAVAMATDTADALFRQAAARGVDLDERARVALEVAERLSAPETARALTRLAEKASALEPLVEMAAGAPTFLAGVTDLIDERLLLAVESGVDVDARIQAALALADKVSAPETLGVLGRLVDRLDTLEPLLDLVEQAPAVVAGVTDTADDLARRLGESGADLDARLRAGGAALEVLTRPEVLAVTAQLAENADRLGAALDQLRSVPHLIAGAVDTLDDTIRFAEQRGLDVDALLKSAAEVWVWLVNFLQGPEINTLLSSGVLDTSSVEVVGRAGKALASVGEGAAGTAGPMDLFRALRDPDVQRSLDFGLRFARRFGKLIDTPDRAALARA